jgi:hypothetical protein
MTKHPIRRIGRLDCVGTRHDANSVEVSMKAIFACSVPALILAGMTTSADAKGCSGGRRV